LKDNLNQSILNF